MDFLKFWASGGKRQRADDEEDSDESMEEDSNHNPAAAVAQIQEWLPNLPEALVQAFPDASIQAPKIVIVGSQSSGKTKLIISMIFTYLIKHPAFTDSMGTSLLKIFPTGKKLTTRRPVTVRLVHCQQPDVCNIELSHENNSIAFGHPGFDRFIEQLNNYSSNEIFETPLLITIVANSLPNMQFTDMPGLTSTAIELKNTHQPKTVENLVEEWMSNVHNTVVVVESAPAYAVNADSASLILPIMHRVRLRDPSITRRSLLVLTMCDKITPGSFDADLLPVFNARDDFNLIIGVINKRDGDPEVHQMHFAQFREHFEATKITELDLFRERGDLYQQGKCTTEAVFRNIDRIFQTLLHQELTHGIIILERKIVATEQQLYHELAPPPSLYHDHPVTAHDPFVKTVLVEEMKVATKHCIKIALMQQSLFAYDQDMLTAEVALLTEVGIAWPDFICGDIDIAMIRKASFEKLRLCLHSFVQELVQVIDPIFVDAMTGIFAQQHSPFHHIARFPALRQKIEHALVSFASGACPIVQQSLAEYWHLLWMNEELAGRLTLTRLTEAAQQTRHLIITEYYTCLVSNLEAMVFDWNTPDLLEESAEINLLRQKLNLFHERANKQLKTLTACHAIRDDLLMRQQLKRDAEELSQLLAPTNEWEAAFWQEGWEKFAAHQRAVKQDEMSIRANASQGATPQKMMIGSPPSSGSTRFSQSQGQQLQQQILSQHSQQQQIPSVPAAVSRSLFSQSQSQQMEVDGELQQQGEGSTTTNGEHDRMNDEMHYSTCRSPPNMLSSTKMQEEGSKKKRKADEMITDDDEEDIVIATVRKRLQQQQAVAVAAPATSLASTVGNMINSARNVFSSPAKVMESAPNAPGSASKGTLFGSSSSALFAGSAAGKQAFRGSSNQDQAFEPASESKSGGDSARYFYSLFRFANNCILILLCL